MIVVDLDGTLLSRNSFGVFAGFLWRTALKKHRFATATQFALWAAARKLRLISHRRLKWQLMKLADASMETSDYEALAKELLKYTNSRVANYLKGKEWLLATAASHEYVEHIAANLDCTAFIATRRPESGLFSDYIENKGEKKLEAVSKFLNGSGIDIAISDHTDDLPLLRAARQRILVKPNGATLHNPQIISLRTDVWD